MTILNAGIIGCGKIGSEFADDPKMRGDIFTHAEAYSLHPETHLAAICDINPSRLEKCGERWNVKARFRTIADMLRNTRLDILSVCTPDKTHYAILKEILTADTGIRAILCEKPLAWEESQAEEIISLAERRHINLTVVYLRRFAQNIRTLKATLDANELGDIQAIAGWYTKGVRHNGTHWFDLLRFLVGEVRWVEAWNHLRDDPEDPTLDVMLGLTEGPVASLRACDAHHYAIFEMEIMGTQGRIRLIDSGYHIAFSRAADSPRYTGYRELKEMPRSFGHRKNVLYHAVDDAVQALKSGRPVACNGRDGLAALRIANAALRAAQEGNRIWLS